MISPEPRDQVSEWQPIETAPFETAVLIWADEGVIEASLERKSPTLVEWVPITLDYHGCGCCGGGSPEPTHWMPMPELPVLEEE